MNEGIKDIDAKMTSYVARLTNADGEHRLGSIRRFALLTDGVDSIAEKVKDAGYELFV